MAWTNRLRTMAEDRLAPGDTIGILGGGQLGRMLATSAAQIGLRCHIYSDDPQSPAFDVAENFTVASFEDEAALESFARKVQTATFEFENIPAAALRKIADFTSVFPSPDVLAVSQDRLSEKQFLTQHEISVAPYRSAETSGEVLEAVKAIGQPALLKTRRLGYDGKGQMRLDADPEPSKISSLLEKGPGLVEGFIEFERELSVVVARDRAGEMSVYDPSENLHEDHILKKTVVPAGTSEIVQKEAQAIGRHIAQQLNFVGVLCVEFFECAGNKLLVNEIAPRVHNSGHWTIDACVVSQFENHIRAVAGWPLGNPSRHSDAEMINLLGDEVEDWNKWTREEGVALHIYGKREIRAGRKMGHVTRLFG